MIDPVEHCALASADWAAVQIGGYHDTFAVDENRYDRRRVISTDPVTGVVTNVRDPVIPICTAAQSADPKAQCSTGSINVYRSAANFRYTGGQLLHMPKTV